MFKVLDSALNIQVVDLCKSRPKYLLRGISVTFAPPHLEVLWWEPQILILNQLRT